MCARAYAASALIAAIVLPFPGPVQSQGDRVIPIFEVAEEDLAKIDLYDGVAEEWLEILGEPTLNIGEFSLFCAFGGCAAEYDPSDLDFVIWLGWRRLTNHIYVAATTIDDRYTNEFGSGSGDYSDEIFNWDSVSITVDGDHSGGPWLDPQWWANGDYKTLYNMQVQLYYGLAQSHTGDHVILELTSAFSDWMVSPPYSDGGGGVVGEQPLIVATEFYVTAFDHLDWTSPDETAKCQSFTPERLSG